MNETVRLFTSPSEAAKGETPSSSLMYLLLMTLADPNPVSNLPSNTICRLLHGSARAYTMFPKAQHDDANSSARLYE